MPETTLNVASTRTEADAVADRSAIPQRAHVDESKHVLVEALPPGWQRLVTNLEPLQPEPYRMRGTTTVHDSTSFVLAVNDQAPTAAYCPVIYGDEPGRSVTAVLNQQQITEEGEHVPGWGDHRVQLRLVRTDEWKAWLDGQGLHDQETFAEFIEEHLDEIDTPPAADMLDLAQKFQAHTAVSFRTATRLKDGQVNLNYEEETTATAGNKNIAIPNEFTIVLRPFIGSSRVNVTCRLRYRVGRGALQIGYQIVRPDLIERTVFDGEVDKIGEGLELPVIRGSISPLA